MKINLIKRGKSIHAGFKHREADGIKFYTACSQDWNINDNAYTGDSSEVTCKRCLKKVKEAEENDGAIKLK